MPDIQAAQLSVSPEAAALVTGILIANLGAIVGAYVSLRVQVAELRVHVSTIKKDLNALGQMLRDFKNNNKHPGG